MQILDLDNAMNELMAKYDWHDTTKDEDFFLLNITYDLVQLLLEHNDADKIIKLINNFEDSNG